MATEYPERPMAPDVLRYACMFFGLANVAGSIAFAAFVPRQDMFMRMFMLIGGLLVGGGWLAFGKYGGLPLVNTVTDWCPPSASGAIEDQHRQGLLVMRRRRRMVWAAIPGMFIAAAILMPVLMPLGHPELVVFLLGVPLAFINFRYYLSRCPRCGLGFFTKSASRAALLRRGDTCGHCGLSLMRTGNHRTAMQDLEQRFAARGIRRGGVLMFAAPSALAFIEAARQQQTPVLGVDSFVVTENSTQPLMEHTPDLSVGGLPMDTWSEARRFVEERQDLGFMLRLLCEDA